MPVIQVLPTTSMNLNQLQLKEALFAAVSAHDYTVDRAAASPGLMGLNVLRDQGAAPAVLASQGKQLHVSKHTTRWSGVRAKARGLHTQ